MSGEPSHGPRLPYRPVLADRWTACYPGITGGLLATLIPGGPVLTPPLHKEEQSCDDTHAWTISWRGHRRNADGEACAVVRSEADVLRSEADVVRSEADVLRSEPVVVRSEADVPQVSMRDIKHDVYI